MEKINKFAPIKHILKNQGDNDQKIIEFAIPTTIAITCLTNISKRNSSTNSKILNRNYWIALIFGLIHGLGFSNYLKALLGGGPILMPLFGFNVGLEIGQILIISINHFYQAQPSSSSSWAEFSLISKLSSHPFDPNDPTGIVFFWQYFNLYLMQFSHNQVQ